MLKLGPPRNWVRLTARRRESTLSVILAKGNSPDIAACNFRSSEEVKPPMSIFGFCIGTAPKAGVGCGAWKRVYQQRPPQGSANQSRCAPVPHTASFRHVCPTSPGNRTSRSRPIGRVSKNALVGENDLLEAFDLSPYAVSSCRPRTLHAMLSPTCRPPLDFCTDSRRRLGFDRHASP